jgi:glycosyltransferase involved in cell wall biosynthesis
VDRLGLADRVHLVGALPDASPAYAAADVVAHVSYQDELPLALLESMAHGKPILCSPIGGVPEILDDQKEGLYVEGGPDAIARGLEQLMSDPRAARRYGEAACRRVDASWIGLHSYRQVEELYGSVRTKRVHFSVDVEEDYHLRGPTYRGVTEALPRLLDIFREEGIRASFFVTADVVRHHSDIVRRIRQEGHHVGSHGLSHQAPPFAGRCFAAQSHDIAEAVSALGPLASDPLAFRAPNFRVDATTMHALALNGVRADASLVPGRVVRRTREAPRLDFRGMPAQTYRISFARPSLLGLARILEAPVAANPFAEGSPLGLGYLNHAGVERTLEALATLPGRDVVFLIHPWEAIDYPENSSRPAWMYKGCSSDLSKLRAFLQQVKSNHATVDFPTLLTAPLSLNCRWWSPGPWASTVRRPRVLLVTNVFRPVTGGVTTYLAGLRDELSSIGFDVSLMAYPARLVRREAVRRHSPFRKLSHLAFAAACLLKVAAWRLRGDPVLVHSHGASFCLLVAYFSRWMGAVGLHTFHSPLTHPSRTLQWFAPRLDALLYVSEETRRLYEESNQLFHDRVGIVPGGVYMPAEHSFEKDERAGLRRRLNLGPKDFAILFVGRVVRDKGVHVAIEAMPRVLEANQHAQLIIAGPLGPSREDERYVRELEDCVRRRGLAESVRFLGLVAEHDLHALYRAADCLVVPSVWDEPAPMVVAEAMSEGLPVAASAVGGLPSQVLDRRNGLLFSPGNSESLARCLLSLMEDETLRSSLGSEARRWIEDHASVEMLGEIHSRIYQGLWREARFP